MNELPVSKHKTDLNLQIEIPVNCPYDTIKSSSLVLTTYTSCVNGTTK